MKKLVILCALMSASYAMSMNWVNSVRNRMHLNIARDVQIQRKTPIDFHWGITALNDFKDTLEDQNHPLREEKHRPRLIGNLNKCNNEVQKLLNLNPEKVQYTGYRNDLYSKKSINDALMSLEDLKKILIERQWLLYKDPTALDAEDREDVKDFHSFLLRSFTVHYQGRVVFPEEGSFGQYLAAIHKKGYSVDDIYDRILYGKYQPLEENWKNEISSEDITAYHQHCKDEYRRKFGKE